jgi:L-ascorbate metabolism protein UlaG (beta-lactamase superfamily)
VFVLKEGNLNIEWLGHSAFRITDLLYNRVIYIDPFKISRGAPADIILVTHEHFDHCSIEDIKRVAKPSTVIISPADCISKFQGKIDYRAIKILKPGSEVVLGNINIKATEAYNTNKQFHPKDNEWVGYLIGINSKKIYHAGDTDHIPEMDSLRKVDIAMMPVSGTYVMTAKEASDAVNIFLPKIAIPMHYGAIIGEESDAKIFEELCNPDEVKVKILEKSA